MSHRPKPAPLTEADIWQDGDPVRITDCMALSHWSRDTVLAEVDCGRLVGYRRLDKQGSPWQFHREDVRAWLILVKIHKPAC